MFLPKRWMLGWALALGWLVRAGLCEPRTDWNLPMTASSASEHVLTTLPDAPEPQQSAPLSNADATAASTAKDKPTPKQQPKRILGVIPNYRAVSEGAVPPPPTPKQAFKLATQTSFDYSAFAFVGITSLLAEGTASHSDLGKGVGGFWAYYWRGFLDKTDGNYLVIAALPSVFHEDERYYTRGEGSVVGRGFYAASRVLITPDYHGSQTFNASEVVGRGIAQAVSIAYYPKNDRTIGALSEKYGYSIGRDAATEVFREFWPDIATHVLHRHP
ncbi:MAG TPA: hypothetical protein VK716_17960 [Terracidiphilus sp.]|nr:hypothetical protein [Terracidiphilus sp.]